MRADPLDRFKFRYSQNSQLHDHQRLMIWMTPSGREYDIGIRTFYDGAHATSHEGVEICRDSTEWSHCAGILKQRLASKENYYLSNLLRPTSFRRDANSRLLRYRLDRSECKHLGRLVSVHFAAHNSYTQDDADETFEEVVEYLNDRSASSGIADEINDALHENITLGECGHWHTIDSGSEVRSGGSICQDCADEGPSSGYVVPGNLNNDIYHRTDDLFRHESDDCYYTYPEDYEDDEDEDEDKDSDGMCSYSTNVLNEIGRGAFVSTATGKFTIGVELEVEARRGCRSELVSTIMAQSANQLICKHDSSLSEEKGVELCTIPMEYKTAISLFDTLEFPIGTKAWDTGVCGLHVHIDSRAFTKLSVAKFLAFWNEKDNGKFIRKIAGRHPDFDEQANDYAKRIECTGSTLQKAKNHDHGAQRYRIANLCNLGYDERDRLGLYADASSRGFSTIELRVFRASLKKNRMLAQIEFAAASVYFARDTSLQAVMAKDFEIWLARNVGMFPHLASFLGIGKVRTVNPKDTRRVTDDESVHADFIV